LPNARGPAELKVGDDLDIQIHPAHLALIEMKMNAEYYDLTRKPSGKVLRVAHSTTDYKFKKLTSLSLEYRFRKCPV
jgi:hypothetical protein